MRVRNHVNPFNFYQPLETAAYATIIRQLPTPIAVEIGCGRGVFLRQFAQQNPDKTIVGIEIRKRIALELQDRLVRLNLTNAYSIYGEGRQVITDLLSPNQIDTLFIFHPDPWLKKRHHNRRFIHKTTLDSIRPMLAKKAKLYSITDVAELYHAMQASIIACPWLELLSDDTAFWQAGYASHWQLFSERDNRACYTLTAQVR